MKNTIHDCAKGVFFAAGETGSTQEAPGLCKEGPIPASRFLKGDPSAELPANPGLKPNRPPLIRLAGRSR